MLLHLTPGCKHTATPRQRRCGTEERREGEGRAVGRGWREGGMEEREGGMEEERWRDVCKVEMERRGLSSGASRYPRAIGH